MEAKERETYSAVVESGSCCLDYSRWEEKTHCGHNHRTIEAAQKCLDKKQRYYCNHGRPAGSPCKYCNGYAQAHSTSALWYNGRIHNQNSERVK